MYKKKTFRIIFYQIDTQIFRRSPLLYLKKKKIPIHYVLQNYFTSNHFNNQNYVQNSAQSLITCYETFAQICTSTRWKSNSFYRVYKYSKTSVDGSCTMYQC